MSELRWNPLYGEWTVTATHRQDRTFFPPPGYCPLCPMQPGGFPTEVSEPCYDIVVFQNKFPSLQPAPPAPAIEGNELYPVRPAQGVCEVVVYTPEHNSSLARQPVEQIYKLMQVWQDRFADLDKLDFVEYVFVFENKGEAVGVTLPHPHGQIYAYPFIPPRMARKVEQFRQHKAKTGENLIASILENERKDNRRIVVENESFTALIPFFARYPYELHIYPNRRAQALTDFSPKELKDLAAHFQTNLDSVRQAVRCQFPVYYGDV